MRVEELLIDGFGHFQDKRIDLPGAPVTVLYGPNEAGKSTLLQFIRTILFGFPSRNRDLWFPPLSGGNHGGRVTVSDNLGNRYVIERFARERKAAASVTDSSGLVEGDVRLRELLGYASKEVFESVFAFSLDELQTSELLKDENVNSHIYSAGLGATELPGVFKKIETEKELIYRPRGSRQVANQLANELDEVIQDIRTLTGNSDQYSDLKNSSEEISIKLKDLESEAAGLDSEVALLRSMRDGWGHWNSLKATEEKLDSAPNTPGLPGDIITRLDALESNLRNAGEELVTSRGNLENSIIDANTGEIDQLILDDEHIIAELNQNKDYVERAVEDYPGVESGLKIRASDFERQLRDLGPGWDSERLQSFDLSTPVILEVQDFEEKITSESQRINNLRDRVSTFEKSRQSAKRLSDVAQKIEGEIGEPAVGQEELNRNRSSVNRCFRLISEHESRQVKASHQESNNSTWHGLLPSILLVGLCTTVSIVIGILVFSDLALQISFPIMILLISSGTILVTRKVMASRLNRDDSTRGPVQPEVELSQVEYSLYDSLSELKIDIDSEDYRGALDSLNAHYDKLQQQLNEWSNAHNDFVRAEREVASQLDLLGGAREDVARAETSLGKLSGDWKSWLGSRNLPTNLSPKFMSDYRAQVVAARSTDQEMTGLTARLGEMTEALKGYEARVSKLADKHGERYRQGQVPTLILAAIRLTERIQAQKDAKVRKTQLEKEVEKCQLEVSRRDSKLEEVRSQVEELLKTFHSDSLEQVRELARENEAYAGLKAELDAAWENIQMLSGPGEQRDRFTEMLGQTHLTEIEGNISSKEDLLVNLKEIHVELIRELERISVQLDQIANEDELSNLQLRRNDLTEQLAEQARNWQRYRLAELLLQRGREKFQKERQPDVIKHAEGFFTSVTGQRYKTLFAPLGEETVAVTDLDGRSKSPDRLSRGTREQLYLALRFGLIREYGNRSESLPVIVDEILVNFDPGRAKAACNAFSELSATNQVLVFTCHPEMVDRFQESCADTKVIEVS